MRWLTQKLQSAMLDDSGKLSLFRLLLDLLSALYAAALTGRKTLYRQRLLKTKRLPCKVISIGNITVGGTGKTPMTIYVARLVQALGYRVAVISRGYKGEGEKSGGVVSDGRSIRMTVEAAGDEPYLLAESLEGIPVLVGRDRYTSGQTAVRQYGANVVVLDDAFQHIRLARDIDLVLLDHRRPFGNFRLLPSGPLREPTDAIARGDAVILTRCPPDETAAPETVRKRTVAHQPVFSSRHLPAVVREIRPEGSAGRQLQANSDLEALRRLPTYAFCGLADNLRFLESLKEMGCQVMGFSGYLDHYRYTRADLAGILREAKRSGAEALATTEKDFTKISGRTHWPFKLFVVGVEVSFGRDEEDFRDYIQKRLNEE